MLAHLRPALTLFLLLTVLTGAVYPALVTAVAQWLFKDAANGSLIVADGQVVGSALIGQSFTNPKYFWGRPSATGPMANNAAASSGSNLASSNPALVGAVKGRIEALRKADPENKQPVPVDLVTASGSGLDPHVSPAGALYQAQRVARLRGLSDAEVKALIGRFTEPRSVGFIGEPRVNVLRLNLALDERKN